MITIFLLHLLEWMITTFPTSSYGWLPLCLKQKFLKKNIDSQYYQKKKKKTSKNIFTKNSNVLM